MESKDWGNNKIIKKIITNVVRVLIVSLTIVLIYSVVELILMLFKAFIVYNEAFNLNNEPYNQEKLFFPKVQGFISAALLITILIELITSLVKYLKVGSLDYVAVIIEIAMIAIVRHILGIDIEHLQPGTLLGLAMMIFVLGLFYFLMNGYLNVFLKNNKTD